MRAHVVCAVCTTTTTTTANHPPGTPPDTPPDPLPDPLPDPPAGPPQTPSQTPSRTPPPDPPDTPPDTPPSQGGASLSKTHGSTTCCFFSASNYLTPGLAAGSDPPDWYQTPKNAYFQRRLSREKNAIETSSFREKTFRFRGTPPKPGVPPPNPLRTPSGPPPGPPRRGGSGGGIRGGLAGSVGGCTTQCASLDYNTQTARACDSRCAHVCVL